MTTWATRPVMLCCVKSYSLLSVISGTSIYSAATEGMNCAYSCLATTGVACEAGKCMAQFEGQE